MAAQPCMEWIPIKKRAKNSSFCWFLCLNRKKPANFYQIDLLPWIWYKRPLGQILVSELATIFQKIYISVFPSVLKRYKEICLNCCLKMITSVSRNLYYPHFFIPGNNKYYTIILTNSSYLMGHSLLILRVTLLW